MQLDKFIKLKNRKKIFTPGPSSLLKENILGLGPCFGRGDKDYQDVENKVIYMLKKICGQKSLISMQGSASLALEMACANFFKGKVLIVTTGYYSDRLYKMCVLAMKQYGYIKKIEKMSWREIDNNNNKKKNFDWIWSCVTETSVGLKIPIKDLKRLAIKLKSKLALDATGSIGLEKDHHLADLLSFSSCKGLFGLTGASFIGYKLKPKNNVNSFYLNIQNHISKVVTRPYHTIQSLYHVLKNYNKIKKTVKVNKKLAVKKFKKYLIYSSKYQPLLCTYLKKNIINKNKNIILYKPRISIDGTILSHLGEAHLGNSARGTILKILK
jgi:2-aminoethylphosphonate-pyruvate transaminase